MTARFVLLALGVATLAAAAPPKGWQLGGPTPDRFTIGVDKTVKHGGEASAKVSSIVADQNGYAILIQRIDAADFAGSRVRFSGWVKTKGLEGWSGLWMRVAGQRRTLALDNMQNRPLEGDHDWTRLEVVLDVPKEAVRLSYGLTLEGHGTAWVDDLQLEKVPNTVPTTDNLMGPPPRPDNLDFEAKTIEPWFISGGARESYLATLVTTPVHGGKQAVHFAPRSAKHDGYGTLTVQFDAKPWRSKRVRVTGWVKTEGVTARGDMWSRAQGVDSPGDGPGLSSASLPLQATADYTAYVEVFEIPDDAETIEVGFGIQGPGEFWLDDVSFEAVDRSVPLAPALPRTLTNPTFEEK